MISKKCIFCGNLPTDKNKEHVLPKWLLKLTGDEFRTVNLGYNWKTQQQIEFNISSFTFPACVTCNSKFAEVESQVKVVVEKLLIDEYLNHEQINIFLDWLDKIRIGIWLAVNYLNKDHFQIEPKFFINQRVGLKDRFLAITNLYNNNKGLTWIGANSPCFIFSPTCLSLQINNLLLLNVSYEFIVSEHLGFPFPKICQLQPNNGMTDYLIGPASKKFNRRLFDTKISEPHIKIMQPIYKQGKGILPEFYDNEYVKENSYDIENGIGKIFIEHDNLLYSMEKDEEVNFSMKEKIKNGATVRIVEPTIELQMELLNKYRTDTSLLSEEQRNNYYEVKKTLLNYSRDYLEIYKKEK